MQCVCLTNNDRLMLFREVIPVLCESLIKHISRLCAQNAVPTLCFELLHHCTQLAILLP